MAFTNMTLMYENLLTSATSITAYSAEVDYPVSNVANNVLQEQWRSTNVQTSQWVLSYFATAPATPNIIAVLNHNLTSAGTLVLSWGDTSACGTGSLELTISSTMCWQELTTVPAKKYYKVTIIESIGAYHKVGEIWLGSAVELSLNPESPYTVPIKAGVSGIVTKGGQLWAHRNFQSRDWELRYPLVSPACYGQWEAAFLDRWKDLPFIFIPQPSDEKIYYARFNSDLAGDCYSDVSTKVYTDVSVNITEYL